MRKKHVPGARFGRGEDLGESQAGMLARRLLSGVAKGHGDLRAVGVRSPR